MELREWLIILGLALVSLIVIDGARRLKRQRSVPRLDQVESGAGSSSARQAESQHSDEEARDAELDWELPNGGARVVRPADYSGLKGKPRLERQELEHPGPSRVLSEFRRPAKPENSQAGGQTPAEPRAAVQRPVEPGPVEQAPVEPEVTLPQNDTAPATEEEAPAAFALRADADDARAHRVRYRPGPDVDAEAEPAPELETTPPEQAEQEAGSTTSRPEHEHEPRRQLRPDTVGEYEEDDEEEYRLVDFEGMGRSMKKHLAKRQKEKQQARQRKQEEKARKAEQQARERAEREARKREQEEERKREQQARAEAQAQAEAEREAARRDADAPAEPTFAEEHADAPITEPDVAEPERHPVLEKALRNDVPGGPARQTLTDADELIVITVMSRAEEGFDGIRLLKLLMACGLRYSPGLGVFHRFETEDEDSALQFSMVNVVKPGSFPVEAGEPFDCPGITFLMPLPGAEDSAAAFEAMVETAMVVVRHMGGELKDENHSVMTAQTIEFARQRVHEFERRHRLQRQLKAQ